MNKRFIFFLTMYVLFSIHSFVISNPRQDIIAVDMDDVFVGASSWSIWSYAAYVGLPLLPWFYWQKITDSHFKEDIDLIFSKGRSPELVKRGFCTDCAYGSITFRLAELARIYEPFQEIFDSLVIAIHAKRFLINEVIEILKKLKDKGYAIVVATNCDRIGFEIKLKALSFNTLYKGEKLFNSVVVGGKSDLQALFTLKNYKRFSQLKPDKQFDDYITTASAYKPEKAYYQVLRNVVNNYVKKHAPMFDVSSPHIVFFDDKKSNVIGANTSDLDIHAYQISKTNPADSMLIGLEHYFGVSFM